MGVQLFDGKKLVDQFASTNGYSDLIKAIERTPILYPNLVAFVKAGETNKAQAVKKELQALAVHCGKPDVANTCRGLANMIGVSTFVSVTHGLS